MSNYVIKVFLVVVLTCMSNKRVRLYIGFGMSIFGNIIFCHLFFNNMLYYIWHENAHAAFLMWLLKNGFVCLKLKIWLHIL
jgi:hypothetical protein